MLLSSGRIAEACGISREKYSRIEKEGTDSISLMLAIEDAMVKFERKISRDYENALRRKTYAAAMAEKARNRQEREERKGQHPLRKQLMGDTVPEPQGFVSGHSDAEPDAILPAGDEIHAK